VAIAPYELCAVNVEGAPAKPQNPLRDSDGDGSLVSHCHIMQAAPWASEKVPPHLAMQAREKLPVQPGFDAFFGTGIGAIERKCPGFPTKPDHGAPFVP
jgi:hypothetical protein